MRYAAVFFCLCPYLLEPLLAQQTSQAIEKELFAPINDSVTLEILTPSFANRKIAKLKLANDLEAYLISDPGMELSAAALAVETGSWKDPKKYPGMAHFCEHMLFMGNETYPQEDEFFRFVTDQGGKANAYTTCDRTVYMFSSHHTALDEGLDRFAHFFIDPLFFEGCVNRELYAVDQEHAKNLEHDGWRLYMILKETGNKEHPHAMFSTGNAQTLGGIPRLELEKWFKQNYSSNIMHLVVTSALPLDQLVPMTVNKFIQIPNLLVTNHFIPEPLASEKQVGSILYVKPVKNIKTLTFLWEMPEEFILDQEHQALDLLSYVLQNQTDTSLIKLLKSLYLAEDIHASSDRLSKDQGLFCLEIDLTEKGLHAIDEVISLTFQTIARLKQTGIPEYIFDELKTMKKLSYQFPSREDPFFETSALVADLVYENITTFPEKTRIPASYAPEFIDSLIDCLTPDSCTFVVTADPALSGVAPSHKEKWMQAEYAVQPIAEDKIIAWSGLDPNPLIQLPEHNPYIPEKLELPAATTAKAPKLHQDALGKFYICHDSLYQVPETAFRMKLFSDALDGSARSFVLSDLYQKAVADKTSEIFFLGRSAGISSSLRGDGFSLLLRLWGYQDKSSTWLNSMLDKMTEIAPTQEEFALYKVSIASEYENRMKELPFYQALDLADDLTTNYNPTALEKKQILETVTYTDFLAFQKNLFAHVNIEALSYGNQEGQIELWNGLKKRFSPSANANNLAKKKVLMLPDQGPFLKTLQTPMLGHAALIKLYQGPLTLENRSVQQILSMVLQQKFFDTLRSQQQTGYIAKSWDVDQEKQLFQLFLVQSSSHHPRDLIARFDLFLEDFNRRVTEIISEQRFETLKETLIKTLEQKPDNMLAKMEQLAQFAFEFQGEFNRIEKRVEAVRNLSYQAFIEKTTAWLSKENRRKLAIMAEGNLPRESDYQYITTTKESLLKSGQLITADINHPLD